MFSIKTFPISEKNLSPTANNSKRYAAPAAAAQSPVIQLGLEKIAYTLVELFIYRIRFVFLFKIECVSSQTASADAFHLTAT